MSSLKEATFSEHEHIARDSRIEVVVSAHKKNSEPGQTLEEMVEAQMVACRLEVSSDLIGEVEAMSDGKHFRAVLTPSMDESNRRQFRGCLEDWRIDSFRLDVIRLEAIGGNTG